MDCERGGCLRPDRRDSGNSRNLWLPFCMDYRDEECVMDKLESANRMETTRWIRFFEQLMQFSDYERKAEMVCPMCKNPFPEVKGLRAAVDRISSCDHCLDRLFSFLNGKRPYSSQEGFTLNKCVSIKNHLLYPPFLAVRWLKVNGYRAIRKEVRYVMKKMQEPSNELNETNCQKILENRNDAPQGLFRRVQGKEAENGNTASGLVYDVEHKRFHTMRKDLTTGRIRIEFTCDEADQEAGTSVSAA